LTTSNDSERPPLPAGGSGKRILLNSISPTTKRPPPVPPKNPAPKVQKKSTVPPAPPRRKTSPPKPFGGLSKKETTPTNASLSESDSVELENGCSPRWKEDSEVTECQNCSQPFTFTNRRHHCRLCGDIFCKTCSKYSVKVEGKFKRVCESCHKFHQKSGSMIVPPTQHEAPKETSFSVVLSSSQKPEQAREAQQRAFHRAQTTGGLLKRGAPERSSPTTGVLGRAQEKSPATAKYGFSYNDPEPLLSDKEKRFRKEIVSELLVTERTYVSQLNEVVNGIIAPLRRSSLTEFEIIGIFHNLEMLNIHHKEFLAKIEDRVAAWTPKSCIGDIFLDNIHYFTSYEQYCKNYNAQKIELLARRSDFSTLRTEFEQKNELPLQSYLICPVQRLPRYRLFLEDLSKHTPNPKHPDKALLSAAYVKLKALLDDLNTNLDPMKNTIEIKNFPVNCTDTNTTQL